MGGMKTNPMAARDKEVKRLRLLARDVQAATDLISLAAAYWDDGAYETATARLNYACGKLTDARNYLADERWYVKQPR